MAVDVVAQQFSLDPTVRAQLLQQQAALKNGQGKPLSVKQRRAREETDAYVCVVRDTLRRLRLTCPLGHARMLPLLPQVGLTEWGFVRPCSDSPKGYRSISDRDYAFLQEQIHGELAKVGEQVQGVSASAKTLPDAKKTDRHIQSAPPFVGDTTHYDSDLLTRAEGERARIIVKTPRATPSVKGRVVKTGPTHHDKVLAALLYNVYEKHPLCQALMRFVGTLSASGRLENVVAIEFLKSPGPWSLVLTRNGIRLAETRNAWGWREIVGRANASKLAHFYFQNTAAACARLDLALAQSVETARAFCDNIATTESWEELADSVGLNLAYFGSGDGRCWFPFGQAELARDFSPTFSGELVSAAEAEAERISTFIADLKTGPARVAKVMAQCEASDECKIVQDVLKQMHRNTGTYYVIPFDEISADLVLTRTGFMESRNGRSMPYLSAPSMGGQSFEAIQLAFKTRLNEVGENVQAYAHPSFN